MICKSLHTGHWESCTEVSRHISVFAMTVFSVFYHSSPEDSTLHPHLTVPLLLNLSFLRKYPIKTVAILRKQISYMKLWEFTLFNNDFTSEPGHTGRSTSGLHFRSIA